MKAELHSFLFMLGKITFGICAFLGDHNFSFLGDHNFDHNLWFMDFYTGISLPFVCVLESGWMFKDCK